MHESILEQTNPILSAEVRPLHRVLLHGLVTTGIVSPPDTLAVAAGIEPAVLPALPGEVVAADPASTVVVARQDEREPAATACCPFTVFACTPAHGEALVAATTGTHLLSLAEALVQGEAIFGDLRRADALPARRRRWPTPGAAATGHEKGPGA